MCNWKIETSSSVKRLGKGWNRSCLSKRQRHFFCLYLPSSIKLKTIPSKFQNLSLTLLQLKNSLQILSYANFSMYLYVRPSSILGTHRGILGRRKVVGTRRRRVGSQALLRKCLKTNKRFPWYPIFHELFNWQYLIYLMNKPPSKLSFLLSSVCGNLVGCQFGG